MPVEIFNLSSLQQQGYLPLDIGAARIFTSSNDVGAVLSTATTPKLDVLSTGALSSANYVSGIVSSAGAAVTLLWAGITTPPDWSTVDGVILHMTGTKNTTASPTQTYGWQIQAVDPTNSALTFSSGQTGALASTVFHVTGTLSSANTPGLNSAMTVSITTSTGADAVRIAGAWLVYGRKRRG